MIVTRVNPDWESWSSFPSTHGEMWIFPLYYKVLEYNRNGLYSKDEKNDLNRSIYMFRDVDENADHGYCSGDASLDGNTYVWWDIVKKKKITKLHKLGGFENGVFKMIFSLHNFTESTYSVDGRRGDRYLAWGMYDLSYLDTSYRYCF